MHKIWTSCIGVADVKERCLIQCRLEQDEDEGGEPPRYLSGSGASDSEEQLLTVAFLRKYIFYCKTKFGKQLLTQDAFEEISQFYVEVRQLAASGVVDPRFRCGGQ